MWHVSKVEITSKSTLANALLPPDLPSRKGVHFVFVDEAQAVRGNPGPLLEQWVGIEPWKRLQYLGDGQLSYLRTRDNVVCRCRRPLELHERVTALPWHAR